jgi:hypothetical protein
VCWTHLDRSDIDVIPPSPKEIDAMQKLAKMISLVVALGFAACGSDQKTPEEPDGPVENAGEEVDEAAEDTGEAAEEAAEDTDEAVEDAADKMEDATDDGDAE